MPPYSQARPHDQIAGICSTAVWVRAAGADIARFGEARPLPPARLPPMTEAERSPRKPPLCLLERLQPFSQYSHPQDHGLPAEVRIPRYCADPFGFIIASLSPTSGGIRLYR